MKKYELSLKESNIATTISEDWLGRNRKLINLMKLLSNVKENFVISIDGNWDQEKLFLSNN